jgi:hypothetical protein
MGQAFDSSCRDGLDVIDKQFAVSCLDPDGAGDGGLFDVAPSNCGAMKEKALRRTFSSAVKTMECV